MSSYISIGASEERPEASQNKLTKPKPETTKRKAFNDAKNWVLSTRCARKNVVRKSAAAAGISHRDKNADDIVLPCPSLKQNKIDAQRKPTSTKLR